MASQKAWGQEICPCDSNASQRSPRRSNASRPSCAHEDPPGESLPMHPGPWNNRGETPSHAPHANGKGPPTSSEK